MKRTFFIIFLILIVIQGYPQKKTRGKVKRKYQQENVGRKDLPEVHVHGKVRNIERKRLAGASVTIPGTWINVHTNENGEYYLKGLPTGRVSICVSYTGYRTKIIDYYLQEGNNDVLFTLDRDRAAIEPLPVTSQLREQHLPDVPQSVSVISRSVLADHNIENWPHMADIVPGLQVRQETPLWPDMVIRGTGNFGINPASQSRVAVFYNNGPVSYPATASFALYDMDRIEVLKSPQNTLFGAGAEAGVVHLLPQKPDPDLNGFLTAGAGDFGMKEVRGAINLPVVKEKLLFRSAGIYTYRDGYVSNTFGGTLNGRNTLGGRMSFRILPFRYGMMDISVNYQKDNSPGTACISRDLPNTSGNVGVFSYEASLNQGKDLKNYRDLLITSAEVKIFRNENNYLYSNTSWYSTNSHSRFDGDGTAAPAIDRYENLFSEQLAQQMRYNFSKRSRLNGSLGANYRHIKVKQVDRFTTDEQYMAYLILQMPQNLVDPNGNILPLVTVPQDPAYGALAGMTLPSLHEDENRCSTDNWSVDLFLDATWRLNNRIGLTGGIRGFYERVKLTNESLMTSNEPSTLGILTLNNPGLFLKPAARTAESGKWKGIAYRANLKFDLYENTTWYAGYTRGIKPPSVFFSSTGESRVLQREVLNSFETGLKTSLKNRLWFGATGFFHLLRDFRVNGWELYQYGVKDGGKATVFGAETSFNAVVVRNFSVYGNYSWIHSRFDKLDSKGFEQEYAGHEMSLAPEHSFAAGIDGRLKLSPWLQAFASPSYTWKSHFWFDDANTPGLEQEAYGTLNATAGFLFTGTGVILSFTGTNLMEEKFLISAGHIGALYGVPTFIPGPPRMWSGRFTWEF